MVKSAKSQEYEVEAVVDMKVLDDGTKIYLVKWKNYAEDQNTWEPIENLENCRSALTQYERNHSTKKTANKNPVQVQKRKGSFERGDKLKRLLEIIYDPNRNEAMVEVD